MGQAPGGRKSPIFTLTPTPILWSQLSSVEPPSSTLPRLKDTSLMSTNAGLSKPGVRAAWSFEHPSTMPIASTPPIKKRKPREREAFILDLDTAHGALSRAGRDV